MRVRMTFAKTEHMRYTGNLDVQRTIERILRRANLAVTHSQGFTPRPKIHIASALPLGFTSDCELADIWLEGDLPIEDVRKRFEAASPPGLQLREISVMSEELPNLQGILETAGFEAVFLDPVPDLADRVRELLDSPTLPRERRDKTYDLRPLILDIQLAGEDADGLQKILIHLDARPGATGRPDEVIAAMGMDPFDVRFHRTSLTIGKKEILE